MLNAADAFFSISSIEGERLMWDLTEARRKLPEKVQTMKVVELKAVAACVEDEQLGWRYHRVSVLSRSSLRCIVGARTRANTACSSPSNMSERQYLSTHSLLIFIYTIFIYTILIRRFPLDSEARVVVGRFDEELRRFLHDPELEAGVLAILSFEQSFSCRLVA